MLTMSLILNIGVVNKKIGNWAITKTQLPINYDNYIQTTQITNNKNIYLASSYGYSIYNSINNGLTWKTWNNTGIGSYGDIHVVESGDGWYSSGTSLRKKTYINDSNVSTPIFDTSTKLITTVFVEEDLSAGLIVTINGDVYKTYNGGETMGGVPMQISRSLFRPSFKLDFNNIWAIGTQNSPNSSQVQYGVIYYCNGDNNVWNEYLFDGVYYNSVVDNIYFIDDKIGYCILRRYNEQKNHLFKTTSGGASWEHISEMEYNTKGSWIIFVNQNEGYLVRDNSVLKTTDGGLTWNIDFTADYPIQNLNFKDNCLYAFTKGMIVRKFLQ